MLVSRDVLENKLDTIISSVYGNKKVVNAFCDNMLQKHNVALGTSTGIIGRTIDVREVSKEMLFWITKELGNALQEDAETSYLVHQLKLDKFFTQIEIDSLSNAKMPNEYNDKKFPIVFEKALKVNDDQYVTVKDVSFVKELRDKQIIRYNPRTQRELTRRKTKDGYRFLITIIKKAINQIMELMMKGKFISNAITLNINADEPAEIEYDEDSMTLTVYLGTIDIIDGNHRYIAMTNVKDNNPDVQYNTIINITHFNEDKAKRYIVQEDKRNPIAKSKIKSLDVDNVGSNIVNNLNDSSRSHLKDMIGTTRGSMIHFGLLVDLINYNFKINTPQEVIKAKKYTVDVFNALIEDDMSLITEKQPDLKWVFYVRIMGKYFESGDINSFMKDIQLIKNINFDKLDIKVNSISKPLHNKVDVIINDTLKRGEMR